MAKRKEIETTGSDAAAQPPSAPDKITPELTASAPPLIPTDDAANLDDDANVQAADEAADKAAAKAQAKAALLNSLPAVEAPSISPVLSEPVAVEDPAFEPKLQPKPEPEVEAAKGAPSFALVTIPQPWAEYADEPLTKPATPRFALKKRHKRYVRLAASVAIGAVFGACVGAVVTGGFATMRHSSVVAQQQDDKAMQQSVAKLAEDVTTLKAKLAVASKLAQAQTAERLKQASAEITGSISVPQTVPAALTPLPMPRPAPRIAMAETQPVRPPVVPDWSVRDSRGGYVYVEGHGDIYQVVPGAPLPGLGQVQSIKKLEGRWVVSTPKGIIVSMRDRRYFE